MNNGRLESPADLQASMLLSLPLQTQSAAASWTTSHNSWRVRRLSTRIKC